MKLSRIALGMAALSLPFAAAQANQSLVAPGFGATTGGVSNPGSVHSSSYNPASSNILIRDGKRFRMGYLSNLSAYIELGDVENLDDEVEILIDDIDALDILDDWDDASQEDRDFATDQLGRFDGCEPGDNSTLANCYQGVADNLNDGLLDELEKGGQLRFGGSVSAPLMPFLYKGGRDWSVGVNVASHMQFKGGLITSPFGVQTTFQTVTTSQASSSSVFSAGASAASTNSFDFSANLDISSDQIGQTYTVLDNLMDEYDNAPDQEAFLDQKIANAGLTADANATEDEKYLLVIEHELMTEAGYTEEQLSGIRELRERIEQDEDFRAALQDGTVELEVDADFTTDTSIEAKAAGVVQLSVNYAHNLTNAFNLDPTHGTLEGGARLNYYQGRMHRMFLSLRGAAEDDATTDDGDDSADRSGDFFADDYSSEAALGLDIGVLWHARNYQLGATLYNVNEPSFDYPDLADMFANSIDHSGNGVDYDRQALENLQAAGKLTQAESVTLTRHTVLEAAYFNDNRTWALQGYYTLGTATNFVGDEFQNAGISAGYFTQSWLLPGVRAGYNQNLKGTELSTINLGATFFGIMNLDVAMSNETSSIDNTDIPRYLAFSLGFSEKF